MFAILYINYTSIKKIIPNKWKMTLGILSCKDIHDVFTGSKFADSII